MVFLLHVGRLPLAISRIVSRNRILCEAALNLWVILVPDPREKKIHLILLPFEQPTKSLVCPQMFQYIGVYKFF